MRKGVSFVGPVNIAPYFGGQISPSPIFSSQKCKIFKLLYYRNYCSNLDKILHNDKYL